ncbi:phage antirepressor N-terminal domain-containing protein, partial [Acinetobacter baumannii]|nr:phage antirepressor N-terminal domain-containing protein [Acinetobacter baumannii]
MSNLTYIPQVVSFHGTELFIVEHEGQPYVPMRSVVQGMGLDWAAQFTKLKQRFATCVVEIAMQILGDDQSRAHTCLLLRKLPAWLYSIMPGKVRPELRDTVILYQQECDDVLWEYWTKGQAINQRLTISPEQQNALHEIVDRRAGRDRSLRASMWIRHNRHFGIAKYSQLLSIHFDDAKQYLELLPLQELVPAETDTLKRLEKFV